MCVHVGGMGVSPESWRNLSRRKAPALFARNVQTVASVLREEQRHGFHCRRRGVVPLSAMLGVVFPHMAKASGTFLIRDCKALWLVKHIAVSAGRF